MTHDTMPAGDVEGHIGTDGMAYLLDLGRALPPGAITCPFTN